MKAPDELAASIFVRSSLQASSLSSFYFRFIVDVVEITKSEER
jgi:hypothetical protein